MRGLDIVCLSHLRWDFVFQRPQHLMSRSARTGRVYFVEEPIAAEGPPRLQVTKQSSGVMRVVPLLPDPGGPHAPAQQRALLDELVDSARLRDYVLWYYTPMALGFSGNLRPALRVYDCMDELSGFRGAPPALVALEAQLLQLADLVFTGGRSLHQAKSALRDGVHCFPSAVDRKHFERARRCSPATDHAAIPGPRLGFAGVIDERMDLDLIAGVASARPEWQLVMVGPITKIDENDLPRADNIHYLGPRDYDDLPASMAAWDVALIPFALNDATRFISPTKTPEYLAAGLPVVSTPIADVVEPYRALGLARIAGTVDEFVEAVEQSLTDDRAALRARADECLAAISWDTTWSRMTSLMETALDGRQTALLPAQLPAGRQQPARAARVG